MPHPAKNIFHLDYLMTTSTLTQAPPYPIFTFKGEMTPEQIAFYRLEGFIHFRGFLEPAEVEALKNGFCQMQRQVIEEGHEKINGVPIIYGIDHKGQKAIHRMPFSTFYHEKLKSLIYGPRFSNFLTLIPEARISDVENDGVIVNQYFNTEHSRMKELGWHTDGLRSVVNGGKLVPMINVGIHLTDSTPAHGGLRVLPRTHNQSILSMIFSKAQGLNRRPDSCEVVVATQAGDVTLHDGRMWHRAAKSEMIGPESYRLVSYYQIINGRYQPKDANSRTPMLHRLRQLFKL